MSNFKKSQKKLPKKAKKQLLPPSKTIPENHQKSKSKV